MSIISANSVVLTARATTLQRAGEGISGQAFCTTENESTIAANQNVKNAFERTLQGHSAFSDALAASSTLIKEIGEGFFTVDTQGARNFIGAAGLNATHANA